jgi:Uma2 family endonuclease
MAAGTQISVEEYLKTTYRPDCDYIDGEVLERNVGELKHGRLEGLIFAWLLIRETRWHIKAAVEVRLKVSARRFRIPDVIILSADAPQEEVIVTPPLVCIEILSTCDTLNQIWDRTQDYLAMGVPACWIIDPVSSRGWIATSAGLVEAKDGILRSGDIAMPLSEILE